MKPTAQDIGFGPRFSIPLLMGAALNPINTTTIAVALEPIARATGVTAATCIWLVAALYLVSAICQPLGGRLSDQFGPRRIFGFGSVAAIIAGIIPTLLPTFTGALIARILIGVGTSCAYPAAMTFIAGQSVRLGKPAPQMLLSALAIAALVVAMFGPPLGGALCDLFGWQSIFVLNVFWGGTQLALALAWLPADSTRPMRQEQHSLAETLDLAGILLFACAVGSLLFFLLDIESHLFWLLPLSIIAWVMLVHHELRTSVPLIDLRMFAAHPALMHTYLRWFLLICSQFLMTYGMSQWVQACMGLSSGMAGLVQLPAAIVGLIGSLLISKKKRVFSPLVICCVSGLIYAAMLLALNSQSALFLLIAITTIFGIPSGVSNVSNQAAMYAQAPIEQMGSASGLQRTCMHTAAVLASCLIGLVYGAAPSDAGVHAMAVIIIVFTIGALAMTLLDRSLREIR